MRSVGACWAPRPGGVREISSTTRGAVGGGSGAGPAGTKLQLGAAFRPQGQRPAAGEEWARRLGRGAGLEAESVRRWPGMPGWLPARGAGAPGPRGNLGDKQGRALTGAAGLPRVCGAASSCRGEGWSRPGRSGGPGGGGSRGSAARGASLAGV